MLINALTIFKGQVREKEIIVIRSAIAQFFAKLAGYELFRTIVWDEGLHGKTQIKIVLADGMPVSGMVLTHRLTQDRK